MRWTSLLLPLLLSACGASATAPDAAARKCEPAGNRERSATPAYVSYADEFKIAERVELPRLEPFWHSSVSPATLSAEPVLAVCVDKQGKCSTRAKGEDWKPRTDPDLLHTLRLFAEESIDGDSLRSNCQVVLGADRNAPMNIVLGVQEMLAQARISRLFLITQERKAVTLLLDISLPIDATAAGEVLILSRVGEGIVARLGQEKTSGMNWAEELAAIVGRVKSPPAELGVSASTVTMLEVETALNACAGLGMKAVRLLV